MRAYWLVIQRHCTRCYLSLQVGFFILLLLLFNLKELLLVSVGLILEKRVSTMWHHRAWLYKCSALSGLFRGSVSVHMFGWAYTTDIVDIEIWVHFKSYVQNELYNSYDSEMGIVLQGLYDFAHYLEKGKPQKALI